MATPERIAQIRTRFREQYGREPTPVRAPGRVNLIGKQTDLRVCTIEDGAEVVE